MKLIEIEGEAKKKKYLDAVKPFCLLLFCFIRFLYQIYFAHWSENWCSAFPQAIDTAVILQNRCEIGHLRIYNSVIWCIFFLGENVFYVNKIQVFATWTLVCCKCITRFYIDLSHTQYTSSIYYSISSGSESIISGHWDQILHINAYEKPITINIIFDDWITYTIGWIE